MKSICWAAVSVAGRGAGEFGHQFGGELSVAAGSASVSLGGNVELNSLRQAVTNIQCVLTEVKFTRAGNLVSWRLRPPVPGQHVVNACTPDAPTTSPLAAPTAQE